MSELVKLVGAKIRLLRKEKGLSQAELATMAGLVDTYLGGVERGTRNISMETLEKIVKALDVSPDVLFRFGDIDTEEDVHEKKQILGVHNALLTDRSMEEVRMVHRVVKDMLGTFDAEKRKK
ncbi:helix-turn-helix domain-containing protein [Paenibacillus alkaliterrae]|uniref:helix-turn-helix domain-containing protein n=1 Tax=Paenibacillus alkaliterrae TaxID=320909 RepID=UPI001F19BD0E|nr:helix-turn-helix transcriptional regulator [Paenibacillus alkaliterrae]MCF2939943.1 helix-turn-helix domain-containing protein [Paenibacillus alkaliterrae]